MGKNVVNRNKHVKTVKNVFLLTQMVARCKHCCALFFYTTTCYCMSVIIIFKYSRATLLPILFQSPSGCLTRQWIQAS